MMPRTFIATLLLSALLTACGGVHSDPKFRAAVERPAFTGTRPVAAIDEAHGNRHTARGRFKPFATVLAADGWTIRRHREALSSASLAGVRLLVACNAVLDDARGSAFTEAEIDSVEAFVRGGGSLLLVADHAPFGEASRALSERFGIGMAGGEVQDPTRAEPGYTDPAQLVFDEASGTLGEHPILSGRSEDERVRRVVTFTGQALVAPPPAVPLLLLSASAQDVPVLDVRFQKGLFGVDRYTTFGDLVPTRGNCQAAALRWGAGRVVVFGEAAVLTAQVDGEQRFGMDWPNTQNRQLALNVARWLGGAELE